MRTESLAKLLLVMGCLLVATLVGQTSKNASGSDLRALYDAHQWFKLREAVRGRSAPLLFRGAVACAFNEPHRAIRDLDRVIRSAPSSDQAHTAHELLTYIYWRTGHYHQVLAQLDALARIRPDAADVRESRKLFAALAQFPEQSVSSRGYSKLRYSKIGGNLFIPTVINGQATAYMLDTGANLPVISPAEAKRRGLKIARGNGKLGDSTVYSLQVGDVAMADDLSVGRFHLKNVSFLVIPDDSFNDIPSERRGVLGFPVLLALDNLRWSADGTFEIGLPPSVARSSVPNLYFDGVMPVTQVDFGESKLNFALDTGAVETDLYPRFATEFASLVEKSGTRGTTHRVTVGGTFELDSITLPELDLRVGGLRTPLRPAHALQSNVGSKWHHGNLGLDLLSQAQIVKLDFQTMTLILE